MVQRAVEALLGQIGIGQVEVGLGVDRLVLQGLKNQADARVFLAPLQTNDTPQVQGLGMQRVVWAHLFLQIVGLGQLRPVVRLQGLLKQGVRCVHGVEKQGQCLSILFVYDQI